MGGGHGLHMTISVELCGACLLGGCWNSMFILEYARTSLSVVVRSPSMLDVGRIDKMDEDQSFHMANFVRLCGGCLWEGC